MGLGEAGGQRGGRAGVQGFRGWGGEGGGIRVGWCVVLPGTRWDFFRDRRAGIRYAARLFPIP